MPQSSEILLLTIINILIVLANLVVLGFSFKLYTEYTKDRLQSFRVSTSTVTRTVKYPQDDLYPYCSICGSKKAKMASGFECPSDHK